MAGQSQPLVRVTGSVHSTKTVTYEGGVNKKTGRAYNGGSYGEVTILTEHSRLNGEVSDLPAIITLRVDTELLSGYGRGSVVDVLVSPFVDVVQAKGQFFNVVGYRFAAEVPAPSPSGSRSSSSASSSAGV